MLHLYESQSVIPNISLSVKNPDIRFGGVIKFSDGDKIIETINPEIIQQIRPDGIPKNIIFKFNDPEFKEQQFGILSRKLYLSDIANQAKKHYLLTGKNVTLVVTSCRSNYLDITSDINKCLQRKGTQIFNNTSFENFFSYTNVSTDDDDETRKLKPAISISTKYRKFSNFGDDIQNMTRHIKFPTICKIIKDFVSQHENAETFTFDELCNIYVMGHVYTQGYNGGLSFDEITRRIKHYITENEYNKHVKHVTEGFECGS